MSKKPKIAMPIFRVPEQPLYMSGIPANPGPFIVLEYLIFLYE